MIGGRFDIDRRGSGAVAPPGSILVVSGTLVMSWMFATNGTEIETVTKRVV